jgi:hypothetical protein
MGRFRSSDQMRDQAEAGDRCADEEIADEKGAVAEAEERQGPKRTIGDL